MLESSYWEKINILTYQIYNSTNNRTLREIFLDGIADLFPYDRGFFDLKCIRNGKPAYYDPITRNIPPDMIDKYYTKYIDYDFTGWIINSEKSFSIYKDSDIVMPSQIKNSVMYKEWLVPLNLFYTCTANISYNDIPYGTATLSRCLDAGDFTAKEMEILEIVSKHMCQRFYQLYPRGNKFYSSKQSVSNLISDYHLTHREYEIVGYLYDNVALSDISDELHISISTIQKHISNIYKKTGVNSRLQLMKRLEKDINRN